jgi:hypothetical protein
MPLVSTIVTVREDIVLENPERVCQGNQSIIVRACSWERGEPKNTMRVEGSSWLSSMMIGIHIWAGVSPTMPQRKPAFCVPRHEPERLNPCEKAKHGMDPLMGCQ